MAAARGARLAQRAAAFIPHARRAPKFARRRARRRWGSAARPWRGALTCARPTAGSSRRPASPPWPAHPAAAAAAAARRQRQKSAARQPGPRARLACSCSPVSRAIRCAACAAAARAADLLLGQRVADLVEEGVAGAGLVVEGPAACRRRRVKAAGRGSSGSSGSTTPWRGGEWGVEASWRHCADSVAECGVMAGAPPPPSNSP